MRFGQEVELGHTGAESAAQPFTLSDGHQRMGELIAAALGIGARKRIQIGEEARPPEGHQQDEGSKHEAQERRHAEEKPGVHAAQKEHAHRHQQDDDQCAQVGLAHDEHADHRQGNGHRNERPPQVRHQGLLAHGIVGHVQHHEELHQLGGLHGGHAQRNPAVSASGPFSDAGHEDQDQQQHAAEEQRPGQPLPACRRHRIREQPRHQCHADGHALADQIEGGGVTGRVALFHQRDGGRIHHHQTQPQQQRRHPHQRLVEALHVAVGQGALREPAAGSRRRATSTRSGCGLARIGSPSSQPGKARQCSQAIQHG